MAKGIAVPYIIAIILGLLVIGLIGYWFFVVYGGGKGQATETYCRGRVYEYCSRWKDVGYGPRPGGKDDFSTSDCPATDRGKYYAPECCGYDFSTPSPSKCDEILGITK